MRKRPLRRRNVFTRRLARAGSSGALRLEAAEAHGAASLGSAVASVHREVAPGVDGSWSVWKSNFWRPAPSTRRRPQNSSCPMAWRFTQVSPQEHNSLVDFHAATDAWSRVCWPLGMTTILPVTRVTGRASSRPAIVRSRSGLRKRRGELREGREGSRSAPGAEHGSLPRERFVEPPADVT